MGVDIDETPPYFQCIATLFLSFLIFFFFSFYFFKFFFSKFQMPVKNNNKFLWLKVALLLVGAVAAAVLLVKALKKTDKAPGKSTASASQEHPLASSRKDEVV